MSLREFKIFGNTSRNFNNNYVQVNKRKRTNINNFRGHALKLKAINLIKDVNSIRIQRTFKNTKYVFV